MRNETDTPAGLIGQCATPAQNAPEWMPIESAPRDGTLVDLWMVAPDGRHGRRVADCRWDDNRSFNGGIGRVAQPDAWVHTHGGEVYLDGGRLSHWQPLPAAPETTDVG